MLRGNDGTRVWGREFRGIDTTRTTVDVMAEGFTRIAKQSIELADAVVKTTSDSAAQAIKTIAARE